jgi:hypothetical protein
MRTSFISNARETVILSEAKDLQFGSGIRSRDPSLRSGRGRMVSVIYPVLSDMRVQKQTEPGHESRLGSKI